MVHTSCYLTVSFMTTTGYSRCPARSTHATPYYADETFDIIAIGVFSSGYIPTHLMSRSETRFAHFPQKDWKKPDYQETSCL